MAIRNVWIITAWFANYEEMGYTSPSEEFHADTYEEAERTRDELLQDPIYENVTIGDEPEERDFY